MTFTFEVKPIPEETIRRIYELVEENANAQTINDDQDYETGCETECETESSIDKESS